MVLKVKHRCLLNPFAMSLKMMPNIMLFGWGMIYPQNKNGNMQPKQVQRRIPLYIRPHRMHTNILRPIIGKVNFHLIIHKQITLKALLQWAVILQMPLNCLI